MLQTRLVKRLRLLSARRLKSSSSVDSKALTSEGPQAINTAPGLMDRWFGNESVQAKEGEVSNRWMMAFPAVGTHLCLGAPWAWSIVGDSCTRLQGFVVPSAADWSMYECTLPLSIIFLMQGVGAALAGKWQMKVGPRKAMATAGMAFGGGFMVGALGIHMHSLPLLYAGYGLLGGTGIALAYTPPIAALMQWFPDKKGIASGLTVAGFGSAALLFAPLMTRISKYFAQMPEYLGKLGDVDTITRDGKLYVADKAGALVEAVQATATDIAKVGYDLPEGLYAVSTGSTGTAEGLAIMGALYTATILASAATIKTPPPNYRESMAAAVDVPTEAHSAELGSKINAAAEAQRLAAAAVVEREHIGVDAAMKRPQFWLLGGSFYALATGGIGMASVAKPMMGEVFTSSLPAIVTSAFGASYVLMLSAGNLGGRLGWSAVSEAIGRPKAFTIFTVGSIPIYLALPELVHMVTEDGSTAALYAFCGSTALGLSLMGGAYATLPAYEADLFGQKEVGPIHGRMLLFASGAAVTGPALISSMRSSAEAAALGDLVSKVPPAAFEEAFQAPMEALPELISSKMVTINKVLALCPPGTIDPTPHLYDSTMHALGGLMVAGAVSHAFVKPIARRTLAEVQFEQEQGDREGRQVVEAINVTSSSTDTTSSSSK